MNHIISSTSDLVDIREVTVDKGMPRDERVAEFVRQIRNPYHFRCGKFVVTARFAEDGPTLEECLQRIIA